MNHIALILLCISVMLAGCSSEPAKLLSTKDKEALVSSYQYWKTIAMGMGPNAIQTPFGRYLILRNGESQLCLKLEKHLASSEEKLRASKYSWVLLAEGKIEDTGTFVISEDGAAGSYWIEIAGFKCEWSLGDWVYFDENLPDMDMAVTDYTELKELEKALVAGWLSKIELEAMIVNDPQVQVLRDALGVESAGTGRPL